LEAEEGRGGKKGGRKEERNRGEGGRRERYSRMGGGGGEREREIAHESEREEAEEGEEEKENLVQGQQVCACFCHNGCGPVRKEGEEKVASKHKKRENIISSSAQSTNNQRRILPDAQCRQDLVLSLIIAVSPKNCPGPSVVMMYWERSTTRLSSQLLVPVGCLFFRTIVFSFKMFSSPSRMKNIWRWRANTKNREKVGRLG
jgi:hypothetical protein